MYCKTIVILSACIIGAFSLDCAFKAKADDAKLNVHDGVDTCESGDNYCLKVDYNGISAKGCSKTALKIALGALPFITCKEESCNDGICCCKGNMCNGVSGASVMMSLLSIGAAALLLKN